MESLTYRVVLLKNREQATKAQSTCANTTLSFNEDSLKIKGAYLQKWFLLETTVDEILPLFEIRDVHRLEGRLFCFSYVVEGVTIETFFALAKSEEEVVKIVQLMTQNGDDATQGTAEYHEQMKEVVQQVTLVQQFLQEVQNAVSQPYVTWLITGVCVLVFLAMGIFSFGESFNNPTTKILLKFGADYGPWTLSGQEWRLLTSAFVHIGVIHICFNMAILLQAGDLVERLFGHLTFALIYFGSALTGNLLSLFIHPDNVSAGASGAIFGIYGAMVAYFLIHRDHLPPMLFTNVSKSAMAFIGYNLFFGAVIPGIDNWCHLGGLLGGFFFGLLGSIPSPRDAFPRRGFAPFRLLFLTISIVAITGGGLYVLWNR